MPFISYAPNQEDVLLWHALGKLETGKLINILRADEGSAKNDAYCKQITRSLSERGWQSHDLFYENDQVEQDLDLPQSQNQSIPVDLVVISGADALSQAFQDWDWGKLSPTIVLVRQDPTQKNAPIQALWQSKLTELGYQFTRQIAHSYFYSSIKAPQIH